MTLHNLRPGQHPYNDASSPQADYVHHEWTNTAFGKPPLDYALYSTPEECDRIQRIVDDVRKEAWQFRVKISGIALAGFVACYFIAEFVR